MEANITIEEIMQDLIQETIPEPRQPGEVTAMEVSRIVGKSRDSVFHSLQKAVQEGKMKARAVVLDGHKTVLFSPSDEEIERRKNDNES